MASDSAIEWTNSTWNPVTGCTKVSPGCKHCYAERMANRLKEMGVIKYQDGFSPTIHPDTLNIPLKWKKPQVIFVNSMSDLFMDEIPEEFIGSVFDVMKRSHWHTFQVLTKRSERLMDLSPKLPWPENIWMGVSVENADYIFRIDHLRRSGARTKFLSIEPLLGPIPDMDLTDIDWVIVGGESGPGARPMKEEWVLEILEQCQKAEVPFFFKQWGGENKKKAGRNLLGQTWDEMPKLVSAS
ncbi:MAG: putative phage protein Gp37/Gp68 [Leptospirillum rubarum]|uniref:Putative phage protein Gp37/Gp68 n=1 Tax=Leptospirillum sp. Group II '5-way CG' TaxID=419541 RepID=B6AS61_9BACT|nr:MAG: putative phage protein Gp37/Gp68 [Leptospirillum rubarum]EDZ38321.1 MAG: Putative phage protein Gp37/Gp68 [Leptospirillum sp. Group II '5-way CG']